MIKEYFEYLALAKHDILRTIPSSMHFRRIIREILRTEVFGYHLTVN